jgi:hypothetical protein
MVEVPYQPRKPQYDWELDMRELSDICEAVYGMPFDIQMGERSNGEYDVVDTSQEPDKQGYHTGMSDYGYKYENATWVELTDEQALDKWRNQNFEDKYGYRAFDKVVNGEYSPWQPDTQLVMRDLVKRGALPPGVYKLDIDW